MMRSIFGWTPTREPLRSLLLLPPRIAVGLGIALGFGLPKIAHFEAFLAEVRATGAPAPALLAAGLLVVEVAGGVAIAAGLATRLAGAALALAMTGILLAPGSAPFPWDVTPFLLGGYFFAITGAGRWSLDALVAGDAVRPSDRGAAEPMP